MMPASETSVARMPALSDLTRWQLVFSTLALTVAFLLLSWFAWRLAMRLDLWQWWIPAALFAGIAAADFGSGIVHCHPNAQKTRVGDPGLGCRHVGPGRLSRDRSVASRALQGAPHQSR